MGLIDFLEGAYQGGRLLFLLYDHDKQVKLRHKAMKGSGIKRLSKTTDNIIQVRVIESQNRALVNEQNTLRKSPLDEEIELSNELGYHVIVHTPSNMVDPVEISVSNDLFGGFVEYGHLYYPEISVADKVNKIRMLRERLRNRIGEVGHLISYGGNVTSGYTGFGEIEHMVGKASESLIEAARLRKHRQELTRKEWDLLAQNFTKLKQT